MPTHNTATGYQSSIATVDSFGYVAYMAIKLDGEWHVTKDPDNNSQTVWHTQEEAMMAAADLNRSLVVSLTARERHSYL